MFGLSGVELLVITLFALLIFGPDRIPKIARTIGRVVADFKRYQATMEATIRAEMREGEKEGGAGEPVGEHPVAPASSWEDDEADEEEEE